MGLRQHVVQLHGAARVVHRAVEQLLRRFVLRPRGFVEGELGVGESGQRKRVARIGGGRALEIGDRLRHLANVERFEPHPAFAERAVGLETGRFVTGAAAVHRPGRQTEITRELRDHLILQLEDVIERTVHLGVGERLAADDVDDPRGDADPVALTLKAADDGQPGADVGGHLLQRSAGAARRLHDPPPIDDAEMAERAEIAGDGFGDAGGQPGRVGVGGHVHEIHDGDRSTRRAARDVRFRPNRQPAARQMVRTAAPGPRR